MSSESQSASVRRRRLRLTLRARLVLVSAVCIGLGWWTAWIHGSRITISGIQALARSTSLRRNYVACADPSVTAEIEGPFRDAGRVSYFSVQQIVPGQAKSIVFWDKSRKQPVATPR
jgi:hypothetical protein